MKYRSVKWYGLVTGQRDVYHRGDHAAVIEAEAGRVVCVCGPADDINSTNEARRIATLLNEANEQRRWTNTQPATQGATQ